MSTTITDLNTAISQAQSDSVKSALNGLLTQLKTVKTDVKSGTVPTTTVTALNAASTTADKAPADDVHRPACQSAGLCASLRANYAHPFGITDFFK